MGKIILIILIFANVLFAQKFKVINPSTDDFAYQLTDKDSIIVKKVLLISENKKYEFVYPDTTFAYKDSTMLIVYSSDMKSTPAILEDIVYKAKLFYLDKKGKEKSTILTIFNEEERYNPKRESVQCIGTTKRGSRCSRYTNDPSGYCWQHK